MTIASAPYLALAGYVVFLGLAFGLRSWIHWRRTGRTGFVGISGALGSVEWLSGLAFAAAVAGGGAAPVLQLAGTTAPLVPASSGLVTVGAVLMAVGIGATLWAQFAMGESWRIGVDPTTPTALVTGGPFAWVRNPIFTSMLIATLGLVLLVPNPWAIASFVVLVVGLELQVRFVEEPWLRVSQGAAYRAYAARTGRFFPGIGRVPGDGTPGTLVGAPS